MPHQSIKNKILIIASVLLATIAIIVCVPITHTYTKTDYALNTIVNITVEANTAQKAEAAANLATDEVKRIEKLLSCYIETSDIYRINTLAYNKPVKVSAETYELLERCFYYNKLTNGIFDITVKPLVDLWDINSGTPKVPADADINQALEAVGMNNIILMEENGVYVKNPHTKIDLGGVAKGYCANRIKALLEDNGIKNALIDLGGNIYAMGKNPSGNKWNIGIQKPFAQRGETVKNIKLSNRSAVTSGGYERYFEQDGKIYHHILNPLTGYPAQSDLKSVTVISANSELCDVLSTAIFASGSQDGALIYEKINDACVIMVKNNGDLEEFGNKSK